MQCLGKPYIKKATRIIPNALIPASSIAIFAVAMFDTKLQNASSTWFNKGWQYIGVVFIVSCFFAAMESVIFFSKLHRFDIWKKKSIQLKLLSEFILIGGAILL